MAMKLKLAEYLMAHGVLKNVDAETMAREIVDMLGVDKLTERNHELEQKELVRSASRPAEAEAMRNVLQESERIKAERDDLKVELFRSEHTNKLLVNENRVLTEERDKLKAGLDASQKACAAVRQYSHKVSAIGYKEGVVGSHVLMLLEEYGKGYFSREQVKPLVEVIVNVLDNFTPDHLNHITCSLLGTRLQQALAHARAMGMEDKP